MTIAPQPTTPDVPTTPAGPVDGPTPSGTRLLLWLVVAATASPIVVAALALIGDPWTPLSDWASLVYRVSEVGGRETPLVGPYSFHGFAHPGPLLYWIAAPLYRLTDGDPRALLWTGAIVNVAAVAAIAGVAWRRGRWPLLLGAMVMVAVVVHGVGPGAMADLWNPYVALLPFALTCLLAWDAALGRPRALVEAVVPATFAVQSHLAYLSLVALVALWSVAWVRWSPRYLGDGSGGAAADADRDDGADRPPGVLRAVGGSRTVRRVAVIAGVLWLAPAVDALFDRHNPLNIGRSLIHQDDVVGPIDGAALVGDYIGPAGKWAMGSTESLGVTVSRVHILMVLAVLIVLAGCLRVARRRQLTDAAALTSLALVLVVGGVVAGARLVAPTPPYLLEWMKVVGGFVWFAVAWTGWRTVEAVAGRRHAAAALAGVALLGGVAWSWGSATDNDPPHEERPQLVADIRSALRDELDDDLTYRVRVVGDPLGHYQGAFYWMIRDGHDVVTSDGAAGLKWGRRHVWDRGDRVDAQITVAVHYPNSLSPSFDECSRDAGQRLLFSHTDLGRADLAWIEDLNLRRLGDDDVTPQEEARWADLSGRDFRIAVYEGDGTCGDEEEIDEL